LTFHRVLEGPPPLLREEVAACLLYWRPMDGYVDDATPLLLVVFLAGTVKGILKYRCTRMTKRRQLSLSPLVLLLIGECPLFCAMLQLLFKDTDKIMELFMDDFSVYGTSFDNCLFNLNKVLQRCEDQHLVLNWEKCHFMVTKGVVLGHRVSGRGIEVDRAKIEAIEKLPYPKDTKGIRSFLRYARFYRRYQRLL
jgi:hypothetical protein